MRKGSDDGTLNPALTRAVLGPGGGAQRKTIPGMVAFLQRRFGTQPPPGLKEHTWRRMRRDPKRGTTAGTREAIRKAFAAARLSEAREARLRTTDTAPTFRGYMQVSDEEPRWRVLDLATWPPSEVDSIVDDVLDAFKAGDPDGMDDAWSEALEEVIGAAIHFSNVQSITFD